MNTTTKEYCHEILDEVAKAIMVYDIMKITETSDRPNVRTLKYTILGQGCLIADRIDDLMHKKYPNQDYSIKIIPSDLCVEVSLI